MGESAQLSFEAFQVGANHGIVFNIYIYNYVEIKEHYHGIHSDKLIKCIIPVIFYCIEEYARILCQIYEMAILHCTTVSTNLVSDFVLE